MFNPTLAQALLSGLSLSFLFSATLGSPSCSLNPKPGTSSGTCLEKKASTGGSNSTGSIAATWYAGWHSEDFPPENISWAKYNHVTYAFASTSNDDNMVSLEDSDAQLLPNFVSLAHQNNVKASLSIGGWDGSVYYSSAVADETNRTAFVKAVLSLATKYSLDGFDFDWEYPNADGIGCNTKSGTDTSNFLSFLQALRAEPAGANLTLSAATSIKPFNGQDGNPMTDVSQFSQVLDFISIMNYDVWGSFSKTVGPNAPLNDTCAPSAADKQGSAVSAVAAWTAAGFPASKIVLGVPSYGHSFSVPTSAAIDNSTGASMTALVAYPSFNAAAQPHGDSWDANGTGVDACNNPNVVGGVFDFWGLIQGGFLTSNGSVASGIAHMYDACSQTPYVYNPSTQVMVSYDDATSFAAKGKFIADTGLAGFAMWEAGGDSGDILLDAIRGAVGNGTGSAGGC
ncbi:glycoside hydrolase [Phellopilus nigrolimitatus]|nr:glycoside hydrolase [Phellopilus nigrolimitatus]